MPDDRLGVALTKCFFCQGDGALVMNTKLTAKRAAQVKQLHGKTMDLTPCSKCLAYMKRGIIVITIDPEKSEPWWDTVVDRLPNPRRTGGWFVVADDVIRQSITDETLLNHVLQCRWTFMDHAAAKLIGLFDVEPVSESTVD